MVSQTGRKLAMKKKKIHGAMQGAISGEFRKIKLSNGVRIYHFKKRS